MAIVGSVGVVTEYPQMDEFLKSKKLKWNTFTAGKYKRGSPSPF
eukprot:gene5281-15458_t